MKKALWLGLIGLILFLSGCGTGDDWKVDVTKTPQFVKGKQSTIEIKVTENNKPVTDLSASALFEMASMDHGTVNLKLKEGKNGTYSGKALLTMAGKYNVVFTLKKEGYTIERALEVDVKKNEAVASINGEPITTDDVEFYRFINKLHISMNREADQQSFSGAELTEKMTYWDDQEKRNEDRNQLLTQIIRLRAMAILATEKGHKATTAEVSQEVSNIRTKYDQSAVAQKLIKDFGEDKFWAIEDQQYQSIVLTHKVQTDVTEKVKADNPSVGEQEITFLAKKQYEDLLVSQVNSMKIEIF